MNEQAKTNTRSVSIANDVYDVIAKIAADEDRTIGKQLERLLKKAIEQGITG